MKDSFRLFTIRKTRNYSCKGQASNGPQTSQAQIPLIKIDCSNCVLLNEIPIFFLKSLRCKLLHVSEFLSCLTIAEKQC